MRDYMKALQRRFETPSQQVKYLEKKVNKAHRKLASKLAKSERKMLLRLTDMEDTLRDEACLDSFMSGYRLAQGIQQELAEIPPYSFEDEDERNAIEKIKAEKQEVDPWRRNEQTARAASASERTGAGRAATRQAAIP